MNFGEEHVLPGSELVLQRSNANHEVEHRTNLARSLSEDQIGAHHDGVYVVLRYSSLFADLKQVLGGSPFVGVDPFQCFFRAS